MASNDDQNIVQHRQRYADMVEEPRRMLPPIQGFEKMDLVSLEEAVKPLVQLVDEVEKHAAKAKESCKTPVADGLSLDESASIRLYTMECKPRNKCLYVVLNGALRTEDRKILKPWFLYLRLVIGAFSKIPSTPQHIFRGVKLNLWEQYAKGDRRVWWGFSSCTNTLAVLHNSQFLGKIGDRTLFDIESYSGKNIRQHSCYATENEVLLLPATQFQVVACLDSGNGLHIIHLKETEPEFPLLEKIPSHPTPPIDITTVTPSITSCPIRIEPIRLEGKLTRRIDTLPPRSEFDLSKERLTDQEMRIVAKRAIGEKQCTKLRLQRQEISSESISAIAAEMRDSTSLEELDLSNNQLTDRHLFPLAQELSTNEGVKMVQWTCCGIARMKELDKAPIKALDLANNHIGDEGVKYLAEVIKTKRTLTSLRLNDNRIGDRGVELLANALSLPSAVLEKLYLHNNTQISDASVNVLIKMFRENRSLNVLWLINCKLTDSGRQNLREAAASKRNFYLNI